MARYRRNIDEDIREAERQWVQTRDHASGVIYARYLLRAGRLELTEFPLTILDELFPEEVGDNVTLYGLPIGNIKEKLSLAIHTMMQNAATDNTHGALSELARHYNPTYGTAALVWFLDTHDLSWRYNWKRFNTQSIRILDGVIDEENLSNQYAALQVDFTLPGHSSGSPLLTLFHHMVFLDGNLINHRGYYDGRSGRNANYLVIFDEIPSDWDDPPRVSYGRCEDFPCCGHDICPPREESSGVQLAITCTCGRLVPRHASSSLCDGCLRGIRREAYYGEAFDDEFDDEPPDDEDDDQDY